MDLLLNAEEVDVGNSGLADAVTQLLSVNMDSDAQDLQEKSSKQEENGIKKKKKKKGLTTEVNLNKIHSVLSECPYFEERAQQSSSCKELNIGVTFLGKWSFVSQRNPWMLSS